MQAETKINSTGYSLATVTGATYTVTGFSWTPTAVLSAHISYSTTDNVPKWSASYPSKSEINTLLVITNVGIDVANNEVDVTVWNPGGATIYIENIIVTAARTP